jgi:hypothetical protein
MMGRLGWAALAILVIAGVVWVAGSAMVSPEGRVGVTVGVALGAVWQLLVLSVLAVTMRGNPLIAHGVGMLGRLAMLGVAALVLVPRAGLPAEPTLFAMVTVLFATTLIEPVAFSTGARDDKTR